MKKQQGNGWKLLGWAVVLVILYTVIFGAFWAIKPIHPQIGTQELDIQIERRVPADTPIQAFSSMREAAILSEGKLTTKQRREIEKKEIFLRISQKPGKLIVFLILKKQGMTNYQLIKKYYYIPDKSQLIFCYSDIYKFRKVSFWKRSYILYITPGYITYVNLKRDKEGR